MPDPLSIIKALIAAAVVSAVVLLLFGLPLRGPSRSLASLGWVLGVAAGFFVGCWFLGYLPDWPPSEDRSRLLAIVLPLSPVVSRFSLPGLAARG